MRGGAASPLRVLIHPVVVNQQVGLQELERGAHPRGFELVSIGCDRTKRRRGNYWTKSFAAPHGEGAYLIDQFGGDGRERYRLVAFLTEEGGQHRVDPLSDRRHPCIELARVGHSSCVPVGIRPRRTRPTRSEQDEPDVIRYTRAQGRPPGPVRD